MICGWAMQVYESNRFTDGGFNHYELYFPDGTTPSDALLETFLRVAEAEPGPPLSIKAPLHPHKFQL